MEAVLQQINAVPGVIGSLICGENGELAAHSFPPLFDGAILQNAADAVAESAVGLSSATGDVKIIDLRYDDARILVKPLQQSFLLLLCTKTLNLQLLVMSLNVATKKLEKLCQTRTSAPISTTTPAIQPSGAVILTSDKGILLQTEIMKSTANTFWDQMLDVVAINRTTALEVSNFFKTGAFKKIKLTNQVTGHSKSFPVRIINNDTEQRFTGKAVISLAIAETLRVSSNDQLLAELVVGGGRLGWEGI